MDLIVCFTPLQVLIANEVINREEVSSEEFVFVYFSTRADEKQKKYYSILSEKAAKSFFIQTPYSFYLLLTLRFKIATTKYNRVFLGSIDDSITHYLLSFCDFNSLITFDDGVGNIVKSGAYFIPSTRSSIKKKFFSCIHWILGRRYYLNDVKDKSSRHYTIYKDFKNCFDNPLLLDLFKYSGSVKYSNNKIKNIVLGTMYQENIHANDVEIVKEKLLFFMQSLDPAPEYIAHPRAEDHQFKRFQIEINDIAEDYILQLLNQGYSVNLYGFPSSCQFNLLSASAVNVFVFYSPELHHAMKDACNMLADVIPENNKVHL